MTHRLDTDLARSISSAALERAAQLHCRHAGIRVEEVRSQSVDLRDTQVESVSDDTRIGIGVRVVIEGSIGFAASVALTVDTAIALVDRAVASARATAVATRIPVELADEPGHGEVTWSSAYRIDPITVPLADKVELLRQWSTRVLDADPVDHVTASVMAVAETKHYADLAGTRANQYRVRVHPQLEVIAVPDRGGFDAIRTVAPPAGRGWEYLTGDGWNWDAELEALPGHLAEKRAAPSVEPGPTDLVIDPTNLWLTLHESVGHATELDRAMGYEAPYAGTSFATPDRLGTLRYGSDTMHVTGDRTAEHGLATVAIDDEGVESQSFDLIRDGILVGYQLDRSIAAASGLTRSNGYSFADSPLSIPIQRMANVSLQPAAGAGPSTEELIAGVERGIYVVGDKSWSIDMQRSNFQFTGQRFHRIENGRLTGQLRDVAYQATTTDFWGSLVAVGGEGTYLLGGAFNCGKGQPGQVAPVSHGCPSALFSGVRILNTRAEAGR
jgi:TldD protein